jgi:predicted DNA-binding transcriptional regulator AlpA
MKTSENLLSMAAFREATGASDATVLRWVKKGLPCHKVPRPGGGRPQVFFDKTDSLSWAAAHGNQTARHRAIALSRKATAAAPDESPETAADGKPSKPELPGDDEGLIPALDRLKKQEIESHRLLIRMKRAKDLNGVLAVSERHLAEVKALSTLENAAVQYRVRLGELGPVADMKGVFLKVVTGLKNAVLGIPSAAVPRLAAHMKNPDSAQAVFAVLDRLVRDTLRDVAERKGAPEPGKP